MKAAMRGFKMADFSHKGVSSLTNPKRQQPPQFANEDWQQEALDCDTLDGAELYDDVLSCQDEVPLFLSLISLSRSNTPSFNNYVYPMDVD